MAKEGLKIPIIDLAGLHGSEMERKKLVEALFHSYRDVGFGYIVNHGISEELQRQILDLTKKFHALPQEKKLEIRRDKNHRGFLPLNSSVLHTSHLAQVTTPNQSESFIATYQENPEESLLMAGTPLEGHNYWPEDLPELRGAVCEYFTAISQVARSLRAVLAEGLGLVPDYFEPHFTHPTSFLRLFEYPQVEAGAGSEVYGAAPHSDYGFFTFVLQDTIAGLQVLTEAGEWIDVAPVPGSLVLNIGDTLHRWSKKVLKATPHRVLPATLSVRYSVVCFFDPNFDTIIDSGTDDGAPFSYGDYLMERLNKNYSHSK